ncbi:MAG: sulfotransferase [Psychroserpens sp.]|uniref:sulfotransferase n=1 Tax=Psychroserpens sp. TaxID=2020870 RepID=UPI0030030377
MNQSIIIAGMHRSGTSLSGNLLEQSGLFIGERLLSGGFDNKKGHFEDLEILSLHEKDLKLKQLDTRGLTGNIKGSLNFEQETNVLVDAFLSKRKNQVIWGWKEPRTTLYLQAWKQKLPNAKCIAIYRHYDEVEDSLIRRYRRKLKYGVGMSFTVRLKHILLYPINIFIKKYEAYKAWCIYNENILEFKKQHTDAVIVVELNHFLNNYNNIIVNVNKQFKTELQQIDVDKIFEKSLLKNSDGNGLKIRVFSKKRLDSVLGKLNDESLWI